MRFDIGKLDRRFRWSLLALAVLFGGLDFWVQGTNPWFKSLFVIAVAGLVGYFTNFLAIKMLFQPKRGQVLGWRGLVPKNQAQIARSLGESVQEQLLSPDVILAYIRDHDLIEQATQSLADWIDRSLQNPQVRREITGRLVAWLDARGPDLLAQGFDLSEQALKQAARNPRLIARYWEQLRAIVLEFLASESNRASAARRMQSLLLTQLPQIADWLDQALEAYLRKRPAVGSVGLGLKSLISLDRAAIEQLLQRFAEDPQVGEQFMLSLDAAIDRLQEELESEQAQAAIQERLGDWIEQLAGLSRSHLLPASIEQLNDYLNDAGNWTAIEEALIGSLNWLKRRALDYLFSEDGQDYLRRLIERAVQRLNVTELVEGQVMQLDTDELEAMVLDNTGGNLTIIQVLGGTLGIIAGTVQVHLAFAVPIAALVLLVYLAWQYNEWRQRRA